MVNRLVLLLLVAVTLGAITWQLYTAPERPGASPAPLPQHASPASTIPAAWSSGNSRFSQGTCTQDSDCLVSGCSGEVCGREDAITTCEYSESFPNAQTYQCACLPAGRAAQQVCGWQQK